MAGCAKTIQVNLGVIEVAELRGSFARIYGATKIRILFFYPSTVGYNQEEEKRQLENWNYQRGAKDCMRLSDSTRPIIFSCILAIGITLT